MENKNKNEILRRFPSVQSVLERIKGSSEYKAFPYEFVKDKLENLIESEKKKVIESMKNGIDMDISENLSKLEPEFFIKKLLNDLNNFSFSLKRVVNGTGVVIHTNLGRSILPKSALENILKISSSYSDLEFNLLEGKRGKRYSHVEYLLKKILKCEKAIVVNNNAAAVFMALSTFCSGAKKEVVVSRGELVEIGGSFRIPDIMSASGAVLTEVGATNKTKLGDYESAINENTALLLKVHQSNFRIIGFTASPSGKDIASMAKKHGIPVMEDLGSGSFVDIRRFGLPYEPTAQEVIENGVDVVTFSGDKLLGGPQAGIIAGKAEYIDRIAANPLNRAFRIDKMTLAGLEAVFFEYLDLDRAVKNIPTLSLIAQSESEIKRKALKLLNLIKMSENIDKAVFEFKITEDFSLVGGGALPDYELKTYSLSIIHKKIGASGIGEIFRKAKIPVIGKIKNGEFRLDMRTVFHGDFNDIIDAITYV
ncbi:MAG: L-seryl-tRNA(Sec) selenium transferase [Deltaproteobacteria bacterium]|jgi:seryl-tRNA(sec) selenium transferase|uniref:L-seryl-tRNA(Sec) selenium transferase n=1 Tax=Candidatus Acidulodesulfobacterium acidiphilum TaxID=2597224 RepID=A0A520XG24_9DELT|nr:L-seryl-tRNA(Sec) selenium transferase [Deltaproteobacteria bacterium]RZV40045.1 MAG: L-seryl-tRNA(Sec) selenium transferase [Candidatus Acidulodesulfobacterium acidiphilum]